MIKQIDNNLYETVCGWWKAKGCEFSFPQEFLPEGYVSFVNGKPIFAGYLNHQNMWGWLTWLVANPDSNSQERDLGFKTLIDEIDKKFSEKGVRFIFTPTNNASLLARFESNGFKRYDSDVVHLLKII